MEFDLNRKTYPRFCLILKELGAKILCAFEVCTKLDRNISILNSYFLNLKFYDFIFISIVKKFVHHGTSINLIYRFLKSWEFIWPILFKKSSSLISITITTSLGKLSFLQTMWHHIHSLYATYLVSQTQQLLISHVQFEAIFLGCRVEGSHGPLVENPNPNIKRRVHLRAVGTVVKAGDQHKWEVFFDYYTKVKECNSKSLTIVPFKTGIPLHKEEKQVFFLIH